jgi:hypothetical protein
MKNILPIVAICLILGSCKKENVTVSSRTHTLRFEIQATGGNLLTVLGRIDAVDSIKYSSRKTLLDTTYVITLGKGDYCNLDIFGQQPSPYDSIPLDYTVIGRAYIDNKMIREESAKFGVGLDIYYDNYIPY